MTSVHKAVELNFRNVEEVLLKNLKTVLQDMPKKNILVGFPAGEVNTAAEAKYGVEGQEDIATYAAKNDFGSFSEGVPSRPFLSKCFDNEANMKKYENDAVKVLTEAAFNNRNSDRYAEQLGFVAVAIVQKNINNGNWTPNSAVTIAKKGSSKPLIDTGTMAQAVTTWVKNK